MNIANNIEDEYLNIGIFSSSFLIYKYYICEILNKNYSTK